MQAEPQNDRCAEQRAIIQQWLADARQAGLQNTYTGKRRRLRVTWRAHLILEILEGDQAGETDYAQAQDISEGCLGIRCRRRVPLWSSVRVSTEDGTQSVNAKVRHCTPTVGGYRLGLELPSQ